MQHVKTATGGPRQADHSLGRHTRGFDIAPNRMRTRIPLDGEMPPRLEPVFIFRMNGDAPPSSPQHRRDILFVVEQQSSGRGAQKRFHSRNPGHPFKFSKRTDVGRRGSDVERIVAMHPPGGPRELVLHGGARRGRRRRVGHLEDSRHASKHGRAATAFQIFLVLIPRLTEMALAVDDTRQNMQSPGIKRLHGVCVCKRSDGRDLARANADVTRSNSVRRGHVAASDDQIERLSHAK